MLNKNYELKFFGLFLIMFSKEVFVFNEEVLIVLAFLIFIYLVLTAGGELISKSLDEKAALIQKKFDIYVGIQEKTIIHLKNYHQKRTFLAQKLGTITQIKNFRVKILNAFFKIKLNKIPTVQIDGTLLRLAFIEYAYRLAFQQRLIKNFKGISSKYQLN